MAKIYVQKFPEVWQSSTSFLSTASATSGSFITNGYARLVGILWFDSVSALVAGSGLRIKQSGDSGSNWDYATDYQVAACSGSAFSVEIVGNAATIEVRPGACNITTFRTLWQLRPV